MQEDGKQEIKLEWPYCRTILSTGYSKSVEAQVCFLDLYNSYLTREEIVAKHPLTLTMGP